MATNENLPPNVIKQLAKELKSLDESPPEGIKVVVNDDDFSTIFADIEGPVGTPYENGLFRMKLILSRDFPCSPPKGYFLTKIFHPNIATNGEICVNTLKKDWNPSLGLRHVLTVVRCLLIEPFPESALNEQAGKMLLENYDEYARHARLYTGIHAKPKPKFKTGAISESTTALNVDPTNASALSTDLKNASATALPLVCPTANSITVVRSGQEQQQPNVVTALASESGVGGSGVGEGVVREGPRSAFQQTNPLQPEPLRIERLMLSLNSISQFLVSFLCRCFHSSILHLPSSSLEAKKRRSRGSASAMITRSNLVEQLREYQIRSKHEWASVSFFSSTSNITSSRVDVVIFVIWELIILSFLVFSAVSLYFRHMQLAFILVCITMLLLLCMKVTKQVRLARKKKRRMLLPLSM